MQGATLPTGEPRPVQEYAGALVLARQEGDRKYARHPEAEDIADPGLPDVT
jgi:hypothetical protein